jgi:hypothetical protein
MWAVSDRFRRMVLPVMDRFRGKRGAVMRQRFPQIERQKVADIGGSLHFWESVGISPRELDVWNINLVETAAKVGHDGRTVRLYDGKRLPVYDGHYDLVVSNSVLEHVPVAERQKFCTEITRTGRAVFVQTPNFWFPLEPHFLIPFQHWLPRRIGRRLVDISPWRLLCRPDKSLRDDYYWSTRLLKKNELHLYFPDCEIIGEKFFGLTKSWYVVGPAQTPSSRPRDAT